MYTPLYMRVLMFPCVHTPTYTPALKHIPLILCLNLFQNKFPKSCVSCGFGRCLSIWGQPFLSFPLMGGGVVRVLLQKPCSPCFALVKASLVAPGQ